MYKFVQKFLIAYTPKGIITLKTTVLCYNGYNYSNMYLLYTL